MNQNTTLYLWLVYIYCLKSNGDLLQFCSSDVYSFTKIVFKSPFYNLYKKQSMDKSKLKPKQMGKKNPNHNQTNQTNTQTNKKTNKKTHIILVGFFVDLF